MTNSSLVSKGIEVMLTPVRQVCRVRVNCNYSVPSSWKELCHSARVVVIRSRYEAPTRRQCSRRCSKALAGDLSHAASHSSTRCNDYSEQVDLDGQIISATCGWFNDYDVIAGLRKRQLLSWFDKLCAQPCQSVHARFSITSSASIVSILIGRTYLLGRMSKLEE